MRVIDASSDAWVAPTGPTLMPGGGFSGPTAEPPAIGSGPGADRRAIAHWDVVPYQTVVDRLSVGVLAYHFNGIDRVEFSLEDGPWVVVREPTMNAATNAVEYQATLDASLVADGPVEIRAIAYPVAGIPRVLQGSPSDEDSSLLLNTNANGTLPTEARYASAGGDDANGCTSASDACLTIARAIDSGSRGGEVGGLEVRLGEGEWVLPQLADGFMPGFTTESRWLTITSAEGASPEAVRIAGVEGPNDGAGMWLKLVHLANVTVTEPVDKSPAAAFEDYLWYDRSTLASSDPDTISMGHCFSWHGYGAYTSTFYTDLVMRNSCDGPRDATLARNVVADETGGGHSSGTATVVNYGVRMIYGPYYPFPSGAGPDYHGDIYQMFGRQEDVIIYHAYIVPGGEIRSRGIVGTSPGAQRDVAIVATDITTDGWVFSFCGSDEADTTLDHMVIIDSRFVGPSDWCGESPTGAEPTPSRMLNILIQNSVFENGSAEQLPQPWDLPGIRYVPPR